MLLFEGSQFTYIIVFVMCFSSFYILFPISPFLDLISSLLYLIYLNGLTLLPGICDPSCLVFRLLNHLSYTFIASYHIISFESGILCLFSFICIFCQYFLTILHFYRFVLINLLIFYWLINCI